MSSSCAARRARAKRCNAKGVDRAGRVCYPAHHAWRRPRGTVDGRIAQLVEQLTLNQRVQGSSPCAPTIDVHEPTPRDAERSASVRPWARMVAAWRFCSRNSRGLDHRQGCACAARGSMKVARARQNAHIARVARHGPLRNACGVRLPEPIKICGMVAHIVGD